MSDYTNPMIDTETLNDLGTYIYELDVESRLDAVNQIESMPDDVPWPLSSLLDALVDILTSKETE